MRDFGSLYLGFRTISGFRDPVSKVTLSEFLLLIFILETVLLRLKYGRMPGYALARG